METQRVFLKGKFEKHIVCFFHVGLRVGYRWVRVRVQIPVPTTYKTSSRTSKTDKNWQRYGQNSRKYCLAHISVISGLFWLFLGSKTRGVAGKGPWVRVRVGKKNPRVTRDNHYLSCFKKINFEKNKKFIYGKPERNT